MTPVAEQVIDEMMPVFREHFGNPSGSHGYGDAAMELLDDARQQVASAVGRKTNDMDIVSAVVANSETGTKAIGKMPFDASIIKYEIKKQKLSGKDPNSSIALSNSECKK